MILFGGCCPPSSGRKRFLSLTFAQKVSFSEEILFPRGQRLSGTAHGINRGKTVFSALHPGMTCHLWEKMKRLLCWCKRGRARRRSPPRRGGSSDAGRTLVPRRRGTAGVRTPAAARQRGGRRTADLFLRTVRDGCLNAGFGVVGGKGLRKPLPPAPRREATQPGCRAKAAIQWQKKKKKRGCRRAGDSARMPGKSRQPGTEKRKKEMATTPLMRGSGRLSAREKRKISPA